MIVGPAFQPRMQLVDAVRGYALMGLFLVHCLELFELYWAHPEEALSHDIIWALFAGKSFSLLGLCFGLSFYILMDRARQRDQDFTLRFIWRLFILGVFGYLHSLIYRGDILQILAPMGLLLIPFDRVKSNALVVVAALLCFAQPSLWWQVHAGLSGQAWALEPLRYYTDPHMPVYTDGTFAEVLKVNVWDGQWFKWYFMIDSGRLWQLAGLFLIGMVLGRIGFFSEPIRFRGARLTWIILFTVPLIGLDRFGAQMVNAIAPAVEGGSTPTNLVWSIIGGWKDLCIMFISMLTFVSLYDHFSGKVLSWLAPIGRMTLTLYLAQSLVLVPVFYGFGLGLHRTLTQNQALVMGIVLFILQVLLARWWFTRFQYGPAEWAWRAATYLNTNIPFRKKAPPAG